jgi:(heptosyl)LPS beta-1,4-glucosyltransferase
MTSTPGKRPTVAAVAIAKNEERDLPGFLRHLQTWVDEIVIVDDGSTDRTLEIIRAAGGNVKLVERRMGEDGFSGQRNAGIEAATSDWLLHMDIDERVTPELAGEISTALGDEQMNGYKYRRLNFFLHRPMRAGGWQRWNNPQLARRGKHRFENVIHERCVIDGGAERTGQLRGFMWHLNDEDYVERVGKNLRYMQMSGEEIVARGTRVRWYHLLLHPTYKALRSYVVDGGFRKGTRGLLLGIYTFSSTFNWWAYAWDRQNRVPRETLEAELAGRWAASRAALWAKLPAEALDDAVARGGG